MNIDRTGLTDEVVGIEGQWDKHSSGLYLMGNIKIEIFSKTGVLRHVSESSNVITSTGQNHALNITLSGGTQITSWFIGLKDNSAAPNESDTMGSHTWGEVTAYSEAGRQSWVDGGISGQSVSNSGSPAAFTIDTDATVIGGAFLVDNSTKGGTTGTLFGVGDFSSAQTLDTGEKINVTYTITASAV